MVDFQPAAASVLSIEIDNGVLVRRRKRKFGGSST